MTVAASNCHWDAVLLNNKCCDTVLGPLNFKGDIFCSFLGSSFHLELQVDKVYKLSILSETLCFSSRLFKAPPPEDPVCPDWSA